MPIEINITHLWSDSADVGTSYVLAIILQTSRQEASSQPSLCLIACNGMVQLGSQKRLSLGQRHKMNLILLYIVLLNLVLIILL